MSTPPTAADGATRLGRLLAAEAEAMRLFDRIEALGLVAPGRSERAVEQDILRLAELEFGVARHWHKRIVRSGPSTLAIAADNPPVREIDDDDIVFLDLGPVFGDWEADVGRSYAIGPDPAKHALCAALPQQFAHVAERFRADPDITGAALYRIACDSAEAAGYRFGGHIAGHIVAEFPHARLPGPRQPHQVGPDNPVRMRDPDGEGRERHWILEIHLVEPGGRFAGFHERLMPA